MRSFHGGRHTVVGKVEATVHPDALLRNLDIVLRVDWPIALGRHPFTLNCCQTLLVSGT
jgi:hypothetical protein